MKGRKGSQINLPLRLTFTDEGIHFFNTHNKKLEKQSLSDNAVGYGITLSRYTSPSVQRMIVADYVSRIEVIRTAFTEKRSEIMDTSKLVFYGILYKRFASKVVAIILKSTFVANWNRANPKRILDGSSIHRFDSGGKLTRGISGKIDKYKEELVSGAMANLSDSSAGEDAEKLEMMGYRYLEHVDPFIWYILSVSGNYNDYSSLFNGLIKLLASYMSKYRIAEHLSLMIMEFSINAELSQLKQLSQRLYKDKTDFNKILSNALVRGELLKYLEKHQEFLTLSWKIHGNAAASIGTGNKLQILIYNKDKEYQKLKDDIDSKKSADIKKKTLLDYYQEESDDRFSSDLGLYYLSFMDEACREQDIYFESNIHQLSDRGLNIITLTLILP